MVSALSTIDQMGGNFGDDPQGLHYTMRLMAELRAERESKGWTAVKLGEESGVHRSIINRAEIGERFPGVPVLVRLCKALGITLSEACRRAEVPEIPESDKD
ncbi:MAG: helix-turn-helix transcriptional regulator [Luteolibacter sp.]